jgi:hypothetical protein
VAVVSGFEFRLNSFRQEDREDSFADEKLIGNMDFGGGYCEGPFRTIENKHKMAVFPRSQGSWLPFRIPTKGKWRKVQTA